MTEQGTRSWLPTVVVLACVVVLTAAALLVIRHFGIGARFWWVPLGAAIVFGTLLVRLLLLAVDNWLDRSDRDAPGPGL